jgi:acyl-CoA reductase-like NAD-dependent aldehyde dehydrogenase
MADRFDAHADELGALVTKENGKILAQGMFESTTAGGTLAITDFQEAKTVVHSISALQD